MTRRGLWCVFVALNLCLPRLFAADLHLLLPLGRTAYQTDETIDLSVARAAAGAGQLALTVSGEDGSQLKFAFPAQSATEHLHLDARLLRPGNYTVAITGDGGSATTNLTVVSHVRKSSFRLVNWGRAGGAQQLWEGEDSLGFNLFYGGETGDNLLRAGVDAMGVCVMGGGHQMELRMDCDWSDPYVTRGGTQRVARNAMERRTHADTIGVHFYDEPGLTWRLDATTGELTPHGIPSQVQSFEAAFGLQPPDAKALDANNPAQAAAWKQWATWKLGFMDAAWKEAAFGVKWVEPDYLTANQSQYGWSAFTDGYYFNVDRGLSVISGHGGYHDFGPGYFNPSYFLEMARARDYARDNWYLPTWYGNTTSDEFRLEQYLSFITDIQGMISPPDLEPAGNPSARQGIVESNLLFQRLGPIFNTLPVTRQPVALLYSMSSLIDTQTKDRSFAYAHGGKHGRNLGFAYLATRLIQQPINTVVDEDVVDGTLAASHKAVVVAGIDYLDPEVVRGLEQFVAAGGVVLTFEGTVKINGAIDLGVQVRMPDQEKIDAIMKTKKWAELAPYVTLGKNLQAVDGLAKALGAALAKAGIRPPFTSDGNGIVAGRQGEGDIEYLFAVNGTYNFDEGKQNSMKAAAATLRFPEDGKTTYDAVLGGPVKSGLFRFGPGELRAFARTARPVGGVKVATPAVHRDLTLAKNPLRVDLAATLLDNKGGLLAGSAPLVIEVLDPLGVTRYELYRATKLGVLNLSLPLAANDPAGQWTVTVRELLNNTTDKATFTYAPLARPGLLAGASRRAVFFAEDADRIFRLARVAHELTLVKGTSPYGDTAIQRLTKILAPWGITCKTMDLTAASKPRPLTAQEAETWCGLNYTGKGTIKPGDGNSPALVGFAASGPVILLGNPEDNPIIKFLLDQKFLPYVPDAKSFPGAGRGYVAWQRDGVGKGQDSVTLIAYDEAGLAEAVGTLYEMVAGLDPLTPYAAGQCEPATPAKHAVGLQPAAIIAWTANLPDRVVAMKAENGKIQVLTHDGSLATLSGKGKVSGSKALAAAEVEQATKDLAAPADPAAAALLTKQARPDRMAKLAAPSTGKGAVAYWGGTVRVVDDAGKLLTEQRLSQDITALAWDGNTLVAGLANGQVVGLTPK